MNMLITLQHGENMDMQQDVDDLITFKIFNWIKYIFIGT